MKIGDLIVYPSKNDRKIHIGIIDGEYEFDPSGESSYPHRRNVKWINSFPRTQFKQSALFELGSTMSLFMIKNYVEDFLNALDAKETATV